MTLFYALCFSMGVMQVYENYKIHFQESEELIFDRAFSLMELAWLCVVIYVLVKFRLSIWGVLTASTFIGYHFFGWAYAVYSIKQSDEAGTEEVVIPLSVFKLCMAWSLVFCLLSGVSMYVSIT